VTRPIIYKLFPVTFRKWSWFDLKKFFNKDWWLKKRWEKHVKKFSLSSGVTFYDPIQGINKNFEWLDSEDGEKFREFLRNFEGLKALEFAEKNGYKINDSLVSDALDATSGSLSFARMRKDKKQTRLLEKELAIIKERWGKMEK